ncbi:MAG: hypothetical protein AMJ73_10110 [candidate division Zixibacteria bacterium SM1_73]|nr:MAG: hypothetical protein AMJ73_10110 [candidate division Zixibacteria bacterium SM1_73]
MTRDEFGKIAQRIEAVYRQEFNDLQFDEWADNFKNEDYQIALEAFNLMKNEYAYFPMVATFRSYIAKAKEIRDQEQDRKIKNKAEEATPMDMDRHKRWMRYIYWILETRQFPKTPDDALKAKEKFEKEHPNWQPKFKEQKRGVQSVGEILKRRS